ncbi:hypothetical protein P280DRAFT_545255 [Massarina eburnea CBS 473.64]|uniref:Uncharacterized protein n=1 Tax=Massarina eburnea CBS 473.64 TaxID=1395130 RepID=A0A6A6SDC1_9PLEO|nr:hypothetical protein P280DRAFT_545255 [Massarina eburnea CBS 473.64]
MTPKCKEQQQDKKNQPLYDLTQVVRDRLPRELRDEIYSHVLDKSTMQAIESKSKAGGLPELYPDIHSMYPSMAQELITTYTSHAKHSIHILELESYLKTPDVFGLGIRPIDVELRSIVVKVSLKYNDEHTNLEHHLSPFLDTCATHDKARLHREHTLRIDFRMGIFHWDKHIESRLIKSLRCLSKIVEQCQTRKLALDASLTSLQWDRQEYRVDIYKPWVEMQSKGTKGRYFLDMIMEGMRREAFRKT